MRNSYFSEAFLASWCQAIRRRTLYSLLIVFGVVGLGAEAARCGRNACAQEPQAAQSRPVGISREPDLANIPWYAPSDMNFDSVPLRELIDRVAINHNCQIVLKTNRLAEAGISPDSPVTLHLQNRSFLTGIKLICETVHLDFYAEEGVLYITTPEDAERHPITVIYDVGEILDYFAQHGGPALVPGGAALPAPEPKGFFGLSGDPAFVGPQPLDKESLRLAAAERLSELITTHVESDSWDVNGGSGTISVWGRFLVVSQSLRRQFKVDDLLAKIRDKIEQ